MFRGIREHMHDLGFVVHSSGLYHLYIAEIPPRTSLVVEGERSTIDGKLYFEVYLQTFDPRSGKTKINVVYGRHLPVVRMVKCATNQVTYWKRQVQRRSG
ncbi:hypothetical protein EY653_05505 [Enterococcus faecalis]|uniref:hypothetical protein n=1 Tax=Enterococcus faecalis TaxID=1351 RepID=UPI001AD73892|nr:hypothetical protein [Enterococcus faecalis]MBO6438759.1 hypothetical protein [Enterococcus faecalis]MBO6453352.1 hypothetical protein [Enterococcus faecalis]